MCLPARCRLRFGLGVLLLLQRVRGGTTRAPGSQEKGSQSTACHVLEENAPSWRGFTFSAYVRCKLELEVRILTKPSFVSALVDVKHPVLSMSNREQVRDSYVHPAYSHGKVACV